VVVTLSEVFNESFHSFLFIHLLVCVSVCLLILVRGDVVLILLHGIVDVSVDGGKQWMNAKLLRADNYNDQRRGQAWAWTLWQATVPLPPLSDDAAKSSAAGGRRVQICAKASDESYNSQPNDLESAWNLRGVLNNVWARTDIVLTPKKK
jgi:hypothetical protein